MKGVGEECHGARDHDQDELQHSRHAERHERDLQRTDPALVGLQRRIDGGGGIVPMRAHQRRHPRDEPLRMLVLFMLVVMLGLVPVRMVRVRHQKRPV